jgi:hypothetical protein
LQIGFLAALVAGGIYFLLTPPERKPTDSLPEVSNSDQPVTAVEPSDILQQLQLSEVPDDSACAVPAGDIGLSAGVDSNTVKWVQIGNVIVPQSALYGPHLPVTANFSLCYQFSAQGAAFAAINYLSALQYEDTRDLLYKRAVATSERLYNDNRNKLDEIERFSNVQIVGYKLVNWYLNATSVDVVFNIPYNNSINYYHLVVPLKWEHGDWKLLMYSDRLDTDLKPIHNLENYIILKSSK